MLVVECQSSVKESLTNYSYNDHALSAKWRLLFFIFLFPSFPIAVNFNL